MPRQRSSSLPPEFPVAGSLLKIRYHSGDDFRQNIFSVLRDPLPSTICSNEQRILRSYFSLLLEEARDAEVSATAKHSSDRQESESGYSCGPGHPASSMADFSESELSPQDSISNRGPSPSDNDRNWTSQTLPGWCNIHGCYMSGEFFDPKYGAWMQVVGPRVRMMCATYCPSSSYADCSVY